MIVQFRNEKVSNHGSIPITIDCNVVAFIGFEEGLHQPVKRTKQEPESSCVSAQKSRISRWERSTTEPKGLSRTFSKVPCMTGWSFNLSVELQFRDCGNLRKCEIPSWTHTLHSSSPSQKVSSFVTLYANMRRDPLKMYTMSGRKIMKKTQYIQSSLITNVIPISEMLNRGSAVSQNLYFLKTILQLSSTLQAPPDGYKF
ncbi:hypothetical protein TNCV_4572911 [Trichonephila clavipes]|nr:hypothetical protein TNCV_4572911 [Trichonephila clavipes]